MRRFPFAVIVAFVASGCAASLPYSADYPLTGLGFRSRDSVFAGKIPSGWISSTEDSLANALTAWLINEDYSAILAVKEIKLDKLTTKHVQREGLKLLAQLHANLEGAGQSRGDFRDFEMQGRRYSSYESSLGEASARVVVFAAKGRFYSCTAQTVRGTWSAANLAELFRVQQTLLASLVF